MTPPSAIQPFLAAVTQSVADSQFIKLSLSHYTGAEKELKAIHVRKVIIKRQEKLSFTYRYKTRDIVKNYSAEESVQLLAEFLAQGFQGATLHTIDADVVLEKDRLKTLPPSQKAEEASLDHNRQKKRLITAEGKPYLHALDITDATGKVHPTAQDKYRQINKYVEILSGLIKHIPAHAPLRIADMGSGKGYLTFALYDYITNTLGRTAEITGVEYRADMVALCNRIAAESGFTGLRFVQGTIADYDARGTHILIALHACDTATDDALHQAITAQADLIVVAPCCHKQIRREMDAHPQKNELSFLMKHGTFVERQAEMVTDGMRAQFLEYAGYSTQVFEFISDAHTPKNVMIVGTKRKGAAANPGALKTIAETKHYFGIGYHHLERLMGL